MYGGSALRWPALLVPYYSANDRLHFGSLTHHTCLFIDMDNIINT